MTIHVVTATPAAQANLLDGATWKDGYYLNTIGGETALATATYTETYIPVRPGGTYTIGNARTTIAGIKYDRDKVKLAGTIAWAGSVGPVTFTAPDNCYFVRINYGTADATKTLVAAAAFTIDNLTHTEDTTPAPTLAADTTDTGTFIGAMNHVIGALLTAKPTARIAMLTHYSADASYTGAANRNYWRGLIDAQKAVAAHWGIPLLDLTTKTGWVNRGGHNVIVEYCSDGIHPDEASFPTLANIVTPWLQSFLGAGAGQTVAWYGTSIPARTNSYADLSVAAVGATLAKYAVASGCVRATKYNGDPVGVSYHSFLDLAETNNVNTVLLDLIGTGSEPDWFIFDYGVNDFYCDSTDFAAFDPDNPY